MAVNDEEDQKIVIRVKMQCCKYRKKALKTASTAYGVSYVGIELQNMENLLVVKGDGINVFMLLCNLRKKLGQAEIITLGDDDN